MGREESSFKFVDLFCGIGGFRIAMERSGHDCVFSSDWDKDAREVYQSNFGDMPIGDITEVDVDDIPKHDFLTAGFPCQPFSISGNLKGFADSRGNLLNEILRISKHHQPKFMLLENVKNFLSHDEGRTLSVTVELLEEAGYRVLHSVLNASCFGVPQKRERIFFVCIHRSLGEAVFDFPKPYESFNTLEDILLAPEDPRLRDLVIKRSDMQLVENLPVERENRPVRIGKVGKGGQGERIYSPKGHGITLSAHGGGVGAKTGLYLIGGVVRRLHPRECMRLMGFPDDFIYHSSQNISFKQFGNSVVVPVIVKILEEIEKFNYRSILQAA